jgi:hypothetical protein
MPDPCGFPRELPDGRAVVRPVVGEHSYAALARTPETS